MKITSLLLLFIAAAAIAAWPQAGLAQGPQYTGSVSNVTFALQFSYTAPGTVRKDSAGKIIKGEEGGPTFSNEWHISNEVKKTEESFYENVSKTVVSKFGNKELLLGLIAAGKLPEYGTTPFIAGWSIVFVSASYTDLEGYTDSGDGKFYAVHKAPDAIVDLNAILQPGFVGGEATTNNYKDYFKEDNLDPLNPKYTHTVTHADSWKESVKLFIDFQGIAGEVHEETLLAELQGLLSWSEKLTTIGTPKTPVYVYGAGKLVNISGVGPVLNEEDGDHSVPDGSITFSPGKALQDVSNYPNLIESFAD